MSRRLLIVLLLLVPWCLTEAGSCLNTSGTCDTPCPAAYGCYFDYQCGPGAFCIPYPDWPICGPGQCTCQAGNWVCSNDPCAGGCSGNTPDSDQDGLPDGSDNCPDRSNPGQRDCDSDGIGDACDACSCDPGHDLDGDAVCNVFDNCPYVHNPSQTNADGDHDGDACDCAPFDPMLYLPREVTGVGADRVPNGSRFHWTPAPPSERYQILGGFLGAPTSGECWTDYDADPTDAQYLESEIPLSGQGWWYLFRGAHAVCGEGPWRSGETVPSCP